MSFERGVVLIWNGGDGRGSICFENRLMIGLEIRGVIGSMPTIVVSVRRSNGRFAD